MQPLVSVLICSYNAEKFIESTIYSVLGQTYKNIELLVLDNASTDKTVDILKRIQLKDKRLHIFAENKNHGAYPGLNYLLEHAHGVYIAINDHDDIWHTEKLRKQISYLEKHKDMIGCGTAIINWYEEYGKGILRTQPEKHTVAWHTSLVYRNESFRYDTSKTVGTDFYFMKNVLCQNGRKIYNFPEPYVFRRIWKGQKNLSSNWMRKMTLNEIVRLEIPFIDKMALLNRKFFPAFVIEYMITHINRSVLTKNTLPSEFRKFVVA